MSNTTYQNFD